MLLDIYTRVDPIGGLNSFRAPRYYKNHQGAKLAIELLEKLTSVGWVIVLNVG